MHRAIPKRRTSLVAALSVAVAPLLMAQEIDVSKYRLHEQNTIKICLGALRAQPDLHAYVCKDAAGQRVVRYLREPKGAKRIDGKHPEAEPAMPDTQVDLYGLTMSPAV